jgi:hypothetical protein
MIDYPPWLLDDLHFASPTGSCSIPDLSHAALTCRSACCGLMCYYVIVTCVVCCGEVSRDCAVLLIRRTASIFCSKLFISTTANLI